MPKDELTKCKIKLYSLLLKKGPYDFEGTEGDLIVALSQDYDVQKVIAEKLSEKEIENGE